MNELLSDYDTESQSTKFNENQRGTVMWSFRKTQAHTLDSSGEQQMPHFNALSLQPCKCHDTTGKLELPWAINSKVLSPTSESARMPERLSSGTCDTFWLRSCRVAYFQVPQWEICSRRWAPLPGRSCARRRWQCASDHQQRRHESSSWARRNGLWNVPHCHASWRPPLRSHRCETCNSQSPGKDDNQTKP